MSADVMDVVKRSITSVTIVAVMTFLILGVFVNPALFFLLTIPAPVVLYRFMDARKPPPPLPSACCTCGGEWGKWGDVRRTGNYTYTDDMSTRYSQMRTCRDCGYIDSRRIA